MWNNIKKATIKGRPAGIRHPVRAFAWTLLGAAAAAVAAAFVVAPLLDRRTDEMELLSIIRDAAAGFDPTISDVVVKSGDQTVKVEAERADVVYFGQGKMTVNSQEVAPEEGKTEDVRGKREEPRIDQIIVPYGKKAELTLDDGTKIWVNSGSKLLYPASLTGDKREVYLIGEAYFDVAEDPDRPFVIKTGDLNVEVKGTTFNVSAYAGEPLQTVTLVSGSVEVRDEGGSMTRMVPDQQFSYDRSQGETEIRNVAVEEYTSWIYGYLLLRDVSLDRLLARLDRHYNVTIHYDPQQLAGVTVSGKLDIEHGVGKALETIGTTAPVTWTIERGGEVTVELSQP